MKNTKNLFWITLIVLFIGLACSSEESKETPRPTPRRSETPTPEAKNTSNENMSNVAENKAENKTVEIDRSNFNSVLEYTLSKRNLKKSDICNESNSVEKRILNEYGAIFLTKATPPAACMFTSAEQVIGFQKKVSSATETIAGSPVELQTEAMDALLKAIDEAKSQSLKITPRDGAEASKRGFDDTLRLWKSRFDPACEHWKGKGKLTAEQISKLKALPMNEQVKEVLELEKQGIYFNTFFNATILSSVAAPGTSQHLSMLAFDATEFENEKVRKVLGNHGWFRTVKGDAPHFTYLGVKEDELKNMGLQRVETKDGEFWIPNV
ncbi:MAG: hypothetical protein AAB336_03760 [Acidobacteriota bacterium]